MAQDDLQKQIDHLKREKEKLDAEKAKLDAQKALADSTVSLLHVAPATVEQHDKLVLGMKREGFFAAFSFSQNVGWYQAGEPDGRRAETPHAMCDVARGGNPLYRAIAPVPDPTRATFPL